MPTTVRDELISLRERLKLPIPRAVVLQCAVHQQHWSSLPAFNVVECKPINSHVFCFRFRRGYAFLLRERRTSDEEHGCYRYEDDVFQEERSRLHMALLVLRDLSASVLLAKLYSKSA